MADVDLVLEQPTLAETASVQVKSRASQTVLDDHIAYFDASGVPTFIREGFASARMKYDPRGLRVEQTWHDANGNPVTRSGNYAGERRAYDRHGRLVETTWLDAARAPTRRSGGYVGIRYRRDDAGRIFETAFLDDHGALTKASEGYAVERVVYDLRGLPLSFSYEDEAGKAVARSGGFAKRTVSYDERGNPITNAWFGVDGRAVVGPGGRQLLSVAGAQAMLETYFPVLVFILFAAAFGFIPIIAGWVLGPNKPDAGKLSPFECGFEPFEDARIKFDVRYYLLAIRLSFLIWKSHFCFPGQLFFGKLQPMSPSAFGFL